ncbi:amidohydrolase family protein [Aquincola tertiaricarbonis]|uniref:amidohydrolase family protein n=1 Tax=Aquincola tertiaricarbonis TaxID=391953 RepID=UPI000614CFB7|nr:amidohydrolase family protein [Aquincola tertiaricarbonis]
MGQTNNYLPVRDDWLESRQEDVLEPDLAIIDAHHHFYDRPGWRYLDEDYRADAASGHAVQASVYMQALTRYRTDGPVACQPVGETAYVAAVTENRGPVRVAAGIVGHADLRLGDAVQGVLEAHIAAGRGRFRGIRHLTTWDADTSLANPATAAPAGLLLDSAYRAGLAQLAPLGLSYDAWLFFPQLTELLATAQAFPDTTIVVNHCGGIVRIGAYQGREEEVFRRWRDAMGALARLPNVHVKLGGLGMRINGFGFEALPVAPSSEHLARHWKPWIETCIEAFGVERCMFESNFPVDKGSCSYHVVWNAFKRLAAGCSPDEKQALFSGTAKRVYRLD